MIIIIIIIALTMTMTKITFAQDYKTCLHGYTTRLIKINYLALATEMAHCSIFPKKS